MNTIVKTIGTTRSTCVRTGLTFVAGASPRDMHTVTLPSIGRTKQGLPVETPLT